MPFDNIIDRTASGALIPEDHLAEIFQGVVEQSVVLTLGKRLRNMSRGEMKLNVLDSLPQAYWVNSDTGLKQTTKLSWANKTIHAEELAVIVPIAKNVLDDNNVDIWSEVRPRLSEAFGKAFDEAALFSTNKPALFPDGLVDGATAAGNVITLGSGTDLYDELLGVDGVISLVENDGYFVTGHAAAISMRGRLRDTRDANGQPIFKSSMQDPTRYELDGSPMLFPRNGAWDATKALLIAGDWSQLVYSIRQEITFDIFDQGVLQDAAGNIVLNLMQQDALGLRAVMRIGWQLPNPVNPLNETAATRYPFGVLLPQ